jgi:protein SCO1/2
MNSPTHRLLFSAFIFWAILLTPSCQHAQQTPAKRYPFTGRVISLDTHEKSAVIDGDNIPGFMDAMTMSYKMKPPTMLNQISPGDSISAEVVVQSAGQNDPASDYWLENVKVTAHGKAPAAGSPQAELHVPASGDEVPDFQLTNQNGKRVSLRQYRGQVLLLTFIYTRCPFPDFCPRVTSNFAAIYKQISSDPDLVGRTHLLSVSFDPEHDSPKVLRDYAYSVAHTRDRALFKHWEFAVPSASDLPKMAEFFALMYKAEAGLITHDLSTTVIAPDGKIARWYHGSDWQVSDLMKDATDALARKN